MRIADHLAGGEDGGAGRGRSNNPRVDPVP